MWLFVAKLPAAVSDFRSPPLTVIPLRARLERSQLVTPFWAPPEMAIAVAPRFVTVQPAIRFWRPPRTTNPSPQILEACELRVGIPMRGLKDSLNVAVAFGIAVHLAARALVQSERAVRQSGQRLRETDDETSRSDGSDEQTS